MKDNAIVTIVTKSFVHHAQTLRASIMAHDATIDFLALVVDCDESFTKPSWGITLDELSRVTAANAMIDRYPLNDRTDHLRWSLKSQLMLYAIRKGTQKVLWCDPDMMFFSDPRVLFEQMTEQSFLLTPHYRALRPSLDHTNFKKNFTEGLFQAGCVGAGQEAACVLDWWSEACQWEMRKDTCDGLYVDQRFLDLVPVLWEQTVISRHRGCNVAEWNWHENRRIQVGDQVLINGVDPVIFIHFTDATIAQIDTGRDQILKTYLDQYVETMQHFDPSYSLPPSPKPVATTMPRSSGLVRRIYGKFKILFKQA